MKISLYILLALGGLILAGCNAGSPTSASTRDTICAPWRSITYASRERHPNAYDTNTTIRLIQIHNRTGQNLGCW